MIARAAGGVDVGDQFRQRQLGEGRGRVVITASTAMEYAFEGSEFWDSKAAMDGEQGGGGVGGSCSNPPPADAPAAEHVPGIGHTARVACNFRKVGGP